MVHIATPALTARPSFRGRAVARLGKRLGTTPARLRLASVAIVAALLLLAVVGTGAVRARRHAAGAVGQQAEPLLVGAEVIYSSLADADATATNIFLKPGQEPPERRQVYLNDLASAGDQLSTVARQAGSSKDAAQALGVITKGLPTYSGLIEAARANNRLGLPVGAAYLREGSTLMQGEILPAVKQLYEVEASRLNSSYTAGRSALDIIAVLVVAAVAIIALILSQLFVTRRTNRILNPGLVSAMLLAVILLAWTLLAFASSARRLGDAQTHGSDPVQLLSSARILVSRAQVDENLALVARGSGGQYLDDFAAVAGELGAAGGSSGLLARAEGSVPPLRESLTGPGSPFADYLAAHRAVDDAAGSGDFAKAVDLATGTATGDELLPASELSTGLKERIEGAQTVFDAKATAGAHDLSRLDLAVIALVVLAAGLAVAGLQRRISEYR